MRAIALVMGLALVGGCAALPWAPAVKPTPGVWQFAYELSATDAAAINDHLTKRARLTVNTTSTPGFDQYGLRDERSGEPIGFGWPSKGGVGLNFMDCIEAVGTCNEMVLNVISATEMTGTMDYYDSRRSIKAGPVKVTARLVTPESTTATPSP